MKASNDFHTDQKHAVFAFDHSPEDESLHVFDMIGLNTAPRERRNEAFSSKLFWDGFQDHSLNLVRKLSSKSNLSDQMNQQVEKQVGVLFEDEDDDASLPLSS